jgi:hypothetical protein
VAIRHFRAVPSDARNPRSLSIARGDTHLKLLLEIDELGGRAMLHGESNADE